METTAPRSFVRTLLPWIVAAVMLLLYLATLDTKVTVQSVFPLARATGLDWHPAYTQPLYWLALLPVSILPAGLQLLGMNFVAALAAALALALLARCVALLPHDRTQLQRDKLSGEDAFLNIRLAWVPVVLAVLVCGWQRSFWEHAVVNTGEALDLLIFAYCVRCVLEYRVEERGAWLNKLAVVSGLACANNFAMIAFLPVLLVALIWIKGLRFFRFDFLSRLILLGLAGLSLYLLLPLVQLGSDANTLTFWQALKANLGTQKFYLLNYLPRWKAAWLGIYALLPLLLAGIRWPSSFGDTSPVGSAFTNIFAQILHAGLLAFGLYIAFDPPAGPREFGAGLVYLPCYFLAALSIGYYSGFLLLVFSGDDGKSRRRSPAVPPMVNYAVTALICAGAVFVAARLLAQNFPKIRELTSSALHDYATELVKALPAQPAIVLSDDSARLFAVAFVLGRDARDKHLLLNAAALTDAAYQSHLQRRYAGRWPKLELEKGYAGFTAQQIVRAFTELSAKQELIYLHPSFGIYFETFSLEPRGLAYALRPYPAGADEAAPPSAALIAQQNAVWNALAAGPWKPLQATLATLPSDPLVRAAHGSTYVAGCYSRALNWWGVELQRAGRFDEAARFFTNALELNPDNASALINQEANAHWRKEGKSLPAFSKAAEEKLQLYRGAEHLLGACGPIDQPDFSMEFAQVFLRSGLYRQAAQQVRRAQAYAPGNTMYETALANVALVSGQPDRALTLIRQVRLRATTATPALQIEVERIAASAEYAQGNFAAAEKLLEAAITKFAKEDASYNALSQHYMNHATKLRTAGNAAAAEAQLTNAVRVIARQVAAQPQNPAAHLNHGVLLMFINDYNAAAAAFTRVLALQADNNAALLNRGMAYLQGKRLDEAKRDYDELLGRYTTTSFQVYYGLGEIAYQRQDWKAAREHYANYLRYAPANADEAQKIRARLEEVKKK